LLATYDQTARDLVTVYEADDEQALERLARHFNRIISFEQVRTGLGGPVRASLELHEARDQVARQGGFKDWAAFLESLGPDAPRPR
jgi:hypothetical protein